MRFSLAEVCAIAGGHIGIALGPVAAAAGDMPAGDMPAGGNTCKVFTELSPELLALADNTHFDGVTNDTREAAAGRLFVALRRERDGHDFVCAAAAAGSPAALVDRRFADAAHTGRMAGDSPVAGRDIPVVIVEDTDEALLRLATISASHSSAIRIGVTGSSGKTTTKDMLVAALSGAGKVCGTERSFNNEIGLPITVLGADDDCDFMVLEMAMRATGDIMKLAAIASPSIGVITNVGAGHIGVAGGLAAVAAVKQELISALPAHGVAVLNADDPRCVAIGAAAPCRVIWFGGEVDDEGVRFQAAAPEAGEAEHATRVQLSHRGVTVDVRLPVIGVYQAANAAAALGACVAAGVDFAEAARNLSSLTLSPMRMHVQVSEDGLTLIDDSYNANPDSMAGALRTLAGLNVPGRRFAVLGQMHELGHESEGLHADIGRLAAELRLDGLVTVGSDVASIAAGAREAGMNGATVRRVESVEDAVAYILDIAQEGDAVLVKASRAEGLERVVAGIKASRRWR